MKEQIGQVKLNYDFYDQQDLYSDGIVEDEILKIVKNVENYDVEINSTDEFAIFYHLSKEREFITEVMDLSKTDKVLEIGAGCGAITGALATKAQTVDCIELSSKRSLINAYKNRNHNNIEIIVGNYENINFTRKYDVATLIGVWEYANYYIHSNTPFHDMLCNVADKLNDNGRIYIAIENRLGIKYFAGCKEDHAGQEFEGIEGYPTFVKAKTFSYYELIQIFHECGFRNYKFYYPYPDYKFPRRIYSDEYLPQKDDGFELASNYSSTRNQYFDELKFIKSLVMDKEFKIFTNSFLICLRK